MNKITLFINDESVFDFDKDITLDEGQLSFLDRMDVDMDKGIKIHGELIVAPDAEQRASFVTMNLIKALQQDNDAVMSSSCAYLMHRFPAINEVHVNDDENRLKVILKE